MLRAFLAAAVWFYVALPVVNCFTPGFSYSTEKVRGVNLGGWLVIEPWIKKSLFNGKDARIIDEYTLCQYQGYDAAYSELSSHWDTWITYQDFEAIAKAGLTHVRIPIGYWAFEVAPGEPYVQGQLPYLWKAVEWSRKLGLKVIIVLYGAPGSQNGFINSGQILPNGPLWHTKQSYIDRTVAIMKNLTDMFHHMPHVVPMIGPLNEPPDYLPAVLPVVNEYYNTSYYTIRYPDGTSCKSNTTVVIHDGFKSPLSYWTGFMPSPQYEGVMIDTHIYMAFPPNQFLNESAHIAAVCAHQSDLLSSPLPPMVGEWTLATTDCAKWINGRDTGASYDGTYPNTTALGSCDGLTGSGSTFSADYKTFLRRMWEAQVISYEKGQGWVHWTWKNDEADEWSYKAGLENGWIPHDPTEFLYPDICG